LLSAWSDVRGLNGCMEEDDGQPKRNFLAVENPGNTTFLARRLSRNNSRTKVNPDAPAMEAPVAEAMDRGNGGADGEASAGAAARTPVRVPALLAYDYYQSNLFGPHPTGLRVKVRRAVPKHLRQIGVTNATWLRWMDELLKVQNAEPYPSVGSMAPYVLQCCFLGELGCGPQLIFNSLACCDGHSQWCREYQTGIRQWLDMLNSELPSPAYAKIISYRISGMWAWVLEIATTEEAAAALREKPIFQNCIPWSQFRGGEHKDNCPPGARAMYGRYA